MVLSVNSVPDTVGSIALGRLLIQEVSRSLVTIVMFFFSRLPHTHAEISSADLKPFFFRMWDICLRTFAAGSPSFSPIASDRKPSAVSPAISRCLGLNFDIVCLRS